MNAQATPSRGDEHRLDPHSVAWIVTASEAGMIDPDPFYQEAEQ